MYWAGIQIKLCWKFHWLPQTLHWPTVIIMRISNFQKFHLRWSQNTIIEQPENWHFFVISNKFTKIFGGWVPHQTQLGELKALPRASSSCDRLRLKFEFSQHHPWTKILDINMAFAVLRISTMRYDPSQKPSLCREVPSTNSSLLLPIKHWIEVII